MKIKTYVTIILVVFCAALLVIFSAGFTQKSMLEKQASTELQIRQDYIVDRQQNCTVVNIMLDNQTIMTVETNASSATTSTQPVTTVTTPKTNTTTTTTTPKTTTVVKPKPKPKPVTRAS
ncbi:MAG: hypothetical protein WC758_00550 [Candidatus Woesearchaeota archaeon]|jgi:hypothetical protein